MIELPIPKGATLVVVSSFSLHISFHRPVGSDGAAWIQELNSLNNYAGIQAMWGNEFSPRDRADLSQKYIIMTEEACPHTTVDIANAVIKKLREMGLTLDVVDGRVADKELGLIID